MQGGRGNGGPFSGFGGPGGFGAFDPFAGFEGLGGSGGNMNLMSGFLGGRDPFDDPFFTQPFGGMFGPSMFGPNVRPFQPFPVMHPRPAYLEQQAPEPRKSRGPIIEELDSDDEGEKAGQERESNPRKHARLSEEPYVEVPEDETEERRGKHLQYINDYNRFNNTGMQPQAQSFSFQSSAVTYGGANGAYYTSSKMRRTGSDGVTIEESKEADGATREAAHRLSRGLHNKGHTVARKLNSNGRVDTMETLHNLHEDERSGFEEAWKGNAKKSLPGWTGSSHDAGASSGGQNAQASRGGWALPSTGQQPLPLGRITTNRAGSSHLQQPGRIAANTTNRAGSSHLQQPGRIAANTTNRAGSSHVQQPGRMKEGPAYVTGRSGNHRWRDGEEGNK